MATHPKYMLYVFDQQKKMLIMIDSTRVEKWCMLSKLLDLTCNIWSQWMFIVLVGTRISSNENSSIKNLYMT
jgi:hypothetical protein